MNRLGGQRRVPSKLCTEELGKVSNIFNLVFIFHSAILLSGNLIEDWRDSSGIKALTLFIVDLTLIFLAPYGP